MKTKILKIMFFIIILFSNCQERKKIIFWPYALTGQDYSYIKPYASINSAPYHGQGVSRKDLEIVVNGNDFDIESKVRINQMECRSIVVVNSNSIRCTVPIVRDFTTETIVADIETINSKGHLEKINSSFTYFMPRSCLSYFNQGFKENGIYFIKPKGLNLEEMFPVYCDMDNGGWTLVGLELANSTGNLLYLGDDIGTDILELAAKTKSGLIGNRFEGDVRLYDYIKVEYGQSNYFQFKLANKTNKIFTNDNTDSLERSQLSLPVMEFTSNDQSLLAIVSKGDDTAKFCRASYRQHTNWDGKSYNGSSIISNVNGEGVSQVGVNSYAVSNAWHTIGFAETAWGIKPLNDNNTGRIIPDVGKCTNTSNSITCAEGAYAPIQKDCSSGSNKDTCYETCTRTEVHLTDWFTCDTAWYAICPSGWWVSYSNRNEGWNVCRVDCSNNYSCNPYSCGWACDIYNYEWNVPVASENHMLKYGGGCSSSSGKGSGAFYGGITGGGFLGVKNDGEDKKAIVPSSNTLIWIK